MTEFPTYYSFAGLSENASRSRIKKAVLRMRRSHPPAGLTKSQHANLVNSAIFLLSSNKDAYDAFLANSKYIYINDVNNYKNNGYMVLLGGIAALLLLDAFIFAIRYVRYTEHLDKLRIAKRERKSRRAASKKGLVVDEVVDTEDSPELKFKAVHPPRMVIQNLLHRVRKLFSK